MAILACGLIFIIGTALAEAQGTAPQQQVPGFGSSQMDGSIQSSASQQQTASSIYNPGQNYDWLSPGGIYNMGYYNWGYSRPYYNTWYPTSYYRTRYYYPSYSYWYWPYYYNSYDPWWNTNIYSPYRTTYYWYSW